jgi:2',3'-cyclic-nucleotide 2'-phosphodiesterase (5'-nucleotidase family)
MRTMISAAMLVGGAFLLNGCNSSDSSAPPIVDTVPPISVTVLHTNDSHARLEPISASGGDPEHGGVARVKTIVNDVRAEIGPDNVLVFDAGDYSQGTIFWNAWKGSDAVMFLNDIGYDAITVGNHEFNLGPGNLAARIEGQPVTIAGVDYATEALGRPVVATNLDLSGEPGLDSLVQPSAIIDRAGVRFGIVGLVTDTTQSISSPGPNVVFLDYVASVQAEVDRLRDDEGIRHVILLSHVNHSDDLELARQLSGVDIIVSGHDHVLLGDPDLLPEWTHSRIRGAYPAVVTNLDGDTTLVVSAWEWTRAVGRLDVEFDDRGRVAAWSGGPIITEMSIPEDADLAQKVADYRVPVDEFANVFIGSAGVFFDGNRIPGVRSQEMPLGNLVTDTMLGYPQLDGLGIAAAVTNGGGIRASINQGDVSFGDALSVLPFGNSLFAMDVTGAELVAALDNGLSWAYDPVENRVRSSGAWPQVAGMAVTYCLNTVADIQATPAILPPAPCDGALIDGGVVNSVEIGGAPVALDQTYRIVTNNFLARGGDFYVSFAAACERAGNFCEDTFFLMLDAFVDEFEKNSPVTRDVEGRLVAQ